MSHQTMDHLSVHWDLYQGTSRGYINSKIFINVSPYSQNPKAQESMGTILIVLTTRSYALTSDATGVANAVWPLKMAFATPVASEVKA